MKKIIILGASVYQVPLIKKAKEMGLYTIVISIPGNYPGFDCGDKSYYVDTTDKEKILKIAIDERIDGICTSGTDVAISTIGYVCEKLGLNGNTLENSIISTNKLLMKKAFRNEEVRTSDFYGCTSADELERNFNKLNTDRAVVKVIDKSGSRGIVLVDSNTNWKNLFDEEMKITNSKTLLIEKYVFGKEIGIDAFVKDGVAEILIPHEKINVMINGIGIPAGHLIPFKCSKKTLNSINEEVNKVIHALKIKNGALNIDAFVLDSGLINIIEAGSRAGATGIPEIISIYTNLDYYELIIKNALNEEINCKYKESVSNVASLLMFSEKDGYYLNCDYKKIEGVTFYLDKKVGDRVYKVEDGSCRVGMAIITGNDEKEIRNKIIEFNDNFLLEVSSDDRL